MLGCSCKQNDKYLWDPTYSIVKIQVMFCYISDLLVFEVAIQMF